MNFGYTLDPGYVIEHLSELGHGLLLTIYLLIVGCAGGTALGLLGGAARAYRVRYIGRAIGAAVEFVRATPLFVQIFFIYFGLPELGIQLSANATACVSLVIWSAAYNTENFRAAFETVPHGLVEAADALGLKRPQTMLTITLPLAVRIAMPSLTNTAIETLKNTALMVAISFGELTTTAIDLVSVSFRVFEIFILIAVIYLLLGTALSRAALAIEHRLKLPTHNA
jgi:polar amino acid transport system permease protein